MSHNEPKTRRPSFAFQPSFRITSSRVRERVRITTCRRPGPVPSNERSLAFRGRPVRQLAQLWRHRPKAGRRTPLARPCCRGSAPTEVFSRTLPGVLALARASSALSRSPLRQSSSGTSFATPEAVGQIRQAQPQHVVSTGFQNCSYTGRPPHSTRL